MKHHYRLLLMADMLLILALIYAFHSEINSFIATDVKPPLLKVYYECEDCNVVIVVFDSLRPDHLHAYGYHRNTSPNIDRFAEGAVLFENAYSPSSWSKPSIASVFTSLYPSVHGSQGAYKECTAGYMTDALSEDVTTLAEILKENDYRTIAFVTNGHISSTLGYGQGFDIYVEGWKGGRVINSEVIALLKNASLGKFFMYLHYMDMHHPYKPPEKYDRIFYDENNKMIVPKLLHHPAFLVDNITDVNYYKAQYDSVILHGDDIFGELLRELPENTIVILTADHGDELYEHGGFGHGSSMYEEVIRVPLIVKIPSIQEGKKVYGLASTIDILPTVLDILDIKKDKQFQGRSLIPNILDDNYGKQYVYSETNHNGSQRRVIISKGYKLIYDSTKQHKNEGYELYNLKNDLKEQNNIISQRPEIAEKLKEIMTEQLEKNRKHGRYNASKNIKLDEDIIERLKYLGYLG